MNERIKQLIEQAEFEENDGHISIQGVYMFNTTRMEKFAELIIRECAKIADDGFASSNFGNGITGHQLLKHFGVK
jgi:hypothetical protein